MLHLTALVLYAGAMLALFGPQILTTMSRRLLAGGNGDDALIFVWGLRWWPHAIAHATNPLFTRVVWAPTGLNLADATTLPGPAVLLAPLTVTAGPIVAFNVLSLVAPALSAWAAYLLCHRITRSFVASLAGGFVFGFSTYEWGQLIGGHLNLSLVFLVPLACYLVARRLEGSIGVRAFVALLALVLVLQFSISTEITATLSVMAAVALVAAVALGPGRWRRPILETTGWSVLAAAIAGVIVSPYLYYAFAYPQPVKAFHPVQVSSDLANFVVPNIITWIGSTWFPSVTARFSPIFGQVNAYMGIPLLIIVVLLGATAFRRFGVRVLLVLFLAASILSLGPVLAVAGKHYSGPMPWRAVLHVPLIGHALPERMMLYAFLAAGVAVALFAAGRSWRLLRWGLVGAIVVSSLPNVTVHLWHIRADRPPFFATAGDLRLLEPGRAVVVVAVNKGDQMLWQAQTDMSFRLAGGYLGVAPPHYRDVEFFRRLQFGHVRPSSTGIHKFRRFVRDHDVGTIVAYRPGSTLRLILQLVTGVRPRLVGGVFVYRLPGAQVRGAAASSVASTPADPSWEGRPPTAGSVTPAAR